MPKYNLSIIILSYNVKSLLLDCIRSIYEQNGKEDFDIIVVDNASTDNSAQLISKLYPKIKIIRNKSNIGFSAGNNKALPYIRTDYVLFLNPDTIVINGAIRKSLAFLETHTRIGALTCRINLPDGSLDKSCHRGLPTPWNAFCYFIGLSELFPKSKLFSEYTASYLNLATTHKVDCANGAFFMVRKIAGEQVGWWDEDYFWNGEDVEFCYRLKEKQWNIIYFPEVQIIHFKGSSSGLQISRKTIVSRKITLRSAKSATQAMRIFYRKHYFANQSFFVKQLSLAGIAILEKIRLAKIKLNIKYK